MSRDTARLQDILEAIERVEKYAVRGREVFEQEELNTASEVIAHVEEL